MKQKYLPLFIFPFLLLFSCQRERPIEATSISGEVANPQSEFLALMKDGHLVDSIPLLPDGSFHYDFGNELHPGLYTFRHNSNVGRYFQSQIFYIERGDSLRFRLNTRDFDRSLMYSGNDAVGNNFLTALFLEALENNRALIRWYYKINPVEFVNKVDSISINQINRLNRFVEKGEVSDNFKQIARKIIDYSSYDLRERYLFLVNKYHHKMVAEIPEDFLDYRDSVNFNDEEIQTHYIYQFFLDDYMKNKPIASCLKMDNSKDCYNSESIPKLESQLLLADSIFKLKSLRSRYLTQFASKLIVQAQDVEFVNSIIDFLDHTEIEPDKLQRVKTLAQVQKGYSMGTLSSLNLVNTNGDEVNVGTLLHRTTAFYYWSLYYRSHHKFEHERVKRLKEKLPNVDFIGINIDTKNDLNNWKEGIENFKYNSNKEYQLVCQPKQRDSFLSYLTAYKLVLVDSKGQVLNGNLSLRDPLLLSKIVHTLDREARGLPPKKTKTLYHNSFNQKMAQNN